jgi:hypothetical protein
MEHPRMMATQCHKPLHLGMVKNTIHKNGDLGDGLLLALPHYLEFIGNLFYLPSGKTYKKLLKMVISFVDLPINSLVISHSKM